jgi:pimeloyl-ACP methyl ester carboxylesterase
MRDVISAWVFSGSTLNIFRDFSYQSKAETFDELKAINHPVLVFEGHYDRLVPVINSYNLYQHIPNARLKLFPYAAHGVIFQYTELFLAEAIPFLTAGNKG